MGKENTDQTPFFVYVWSHEMGPLYIGQSQDPHRPFRAEITKKLHEIRGKFSLELIPCRSREESLGLERFLIFQMEPALNKFQPTYPTTLTPRFENKPNQDNMTSNIMAIRVSNGPGLPSLNDPEIHK